VAAICHEVCTDEKYSEKSPPITEELLEFGALPCDVIKAIEEVVQEDRDEEKSNAKDAVVESMNKSVSNINGEKAVENSASRNNR
jgi:hypothetical protein